MVASHDDSVIGRVTRRQALGLGLGACASTVLARYVVSPGRVEAQAGGEALAAAGQGQSLTIQFADAPTSMNPGEATLGPSQVYQLLAYDPLIHYTASGSYEPDLATEWGYEDNNNQVFRLSLREGVKFSDGSDLDAAAVVQWINYVKQVGTAPALAALSHTQTPDALTVVLHFSEPSPALETTFSQRTPAGLVASPSALKNPKAMETATYGAGQYIYEQSQSVAGSEQTYVQNPHYWQRSAVHYKTVTVKAIANPATVEDALTSGQIDVAYSATPATAAIASQAAKIVAPYCFNCLLTLDREGVVLKPLGDPRVRQALSYAVDGAAIGKAIWTNRYMTPSQNILSPGTIGYSASLDNSYPYNQAKARQLLAEAGYAHGFTLPLTVLGPMDPNSTFTEAVAAQLNSVGIQTTIKVIPTIQEFIPLQMSKKLPLMVHQPLLGLSMLEFYNNYLAPTSGFNPFGVVDAEVQTLMAKAARMSASNAGAVYEMVAKRVIQLAWFNPYYHFDEILLTDKKVANVAISGANNIPDPVAPVASEGWRPE